jgi:polysaccharide export outer membrane protein
MIRLALICAMLAAHAVPAFAQNRPDTYLIEPGDQLGISVLEDPGLNTTVLVRPDGRIAMPLVGTILVEGRSPEQVQDAIRRGLARDFVAPPTVTVSLVGLGSAPDAPAFFILGEIGRPGRYEMLTPVNLLQALAVAGGPGTFAATSRIQLRRKVGDADTVATFNYDLIEEGVAPVDNIELQDGDVIVIPQRGLFE